MKTLSDYNIIDKVISKVTDHEPNKRFLTKNYFELLCITNGSHKIQTFLMKNVFELSFLDK